MKKIESLFLISLVSLTSLLSSCKIKLDTYEIETEKIYELAKEAGFSGSYDDWVNSIQGEPGVDGKSVKSITKSEIDLETLKEVYTFTYSDGTTSNIEMPLFKGEKGEVGSKGEIGDKGPKGDKGETGAPGINGTNGTNGKQGEVGDKGPTGDNGQNGRDGFTPYIGENGNWWIQNTDSKICAIGKNGLPAPKVQNIELILTDDLSETYEITYDSGLKLTYTCEKYVRYDETKILGKWHDQIYKFDYNFINENEGFVSCFDIFKFYFNYTIQNDYVMFNYTIHNDYTNGLPTNLVIVKDTNNIVYLTDSRFALLTREYNQNFDYIYGPFGMFVSTKELGTYHFNFLNNDSNLKIEKAELLNIDNNKVYLPIVDGDYILKSESSSKDIYIYNTINDNGQNAIEIYENFHLPNHPTIVNNTSTIEDIYLNHINSALIIYKDGHREKASLEHLGNDIFKLYLQNKYIKFKFDRNLNQISELNIYPNKTNINKFVFSNKQNDVVLTFKDIDGYNCEVEAKIGTKALKGENIPREQLFNKYGTSRIDFFPVYVDINNLEHTLKISSNDNSINLDWMNYEIDIIDFISDDFDNIYQKIETKPNKILINNVEYDYTSRYEKDRLIYDLIDNTVDDVYIDMGKCQAYFAGPIFDSNYYKNFKNKVIHGTGRYKEENLRSICFDLEFDSTGKILSYVNFHIKINGFESLIDKELIFEGSNIAPTYDAYNGELILFKNDIYTAKFIKSTYQDRMYLYKNDELILDTYFN